MKTAFSLIFAALALQTVSSFCIGPIGNSLLSGPILTSSPCASQVLVTSPCASQVVAAPPACSCAPQVVVSQAPQVVVAQPPQVVVAPPQVVLSSPSVIAASVTPSNSVAASLADTLSLLTVSSLLAETLPLPTVLPVNYSPCGCGGALYI